MLIHVPFWLGLLIVLAMQGILGLFGYEVMHLFQKWMSIVLGLMFVVITVKLVRSATSIRPRPSMAALGWADSFS